MKGIKKKKTIKTQFENYFNNYIGNCKVISPKMSLYIFTHYLETSGYRYMVNKVH